jgi:hypothetical protein
MLLKVINWFDGTPLNFHIAVENVVELTYVRERRYERDRWETTRRDTFDRHGVSSGQPYKKDDLLHLHFYS